MELGKDLAMRLSSGDEEALPQNRLKRKKEKMHRVPRSRKRKPAKKSRKPKGGFGIIPLDSICRLRGEPEEGEKELACVRANVVIQQSFESAKVDKGTLAIIPEQGKAETIPSRAEMVEGDTEGKSSRVAEDISRDELSIIDISGSPQISDAMIREVNMLEGRSYEGIQESTDIHDILDVLESAASEEIIGFDGLPASVLHHEVFLRIREDHETEVRNLTEKSDSYKLLSEKLRADLSMARDEREEITEQVFRILHDSEDELEITTNDPILQVRQRLEQIGWLNSQVDELLAEADKFKKNMDILASKKEVVQAQLELVEAQLRAAKENASVHIEKIKELHYRLDLATSDKANLADELEVARFEVAVARSEVVVARSEVDISRSEVVVARSKVAEANKRADAKVAQFRIDVEVN
ncbi:uncharacterized protein [Nicotiana tomentosiformis]|uniref:uncharacterized protein n=1 Tax=Nicotiana tomentosiformis TaxID=4098 RepID=UPI00388CB360